MSATMRSLGIDQLSREERWRLVEEICQILEDDAGGLLTEAQQADLKLRLEEHRRHPEEAVSWKDAKQQLGWD